MHVVQQSVQRLLLLPLLLLNVMLINLTTCHPQAGHATAASASASSLVSDATESHARHYQHQRSHHERWWPPSLASHQHRHHRQQKRQQQQQQQSQSIDEPIALPLQWSPPSDQSEIELLAMKPPNMSQYLDNTTNEPKHDIWVMLFMCSPASSKHVNECRKWYKKDTDQYGRQGQPCCSRAKLAACISSGLRSPCDRFAEPMVQMIANSTRACDHISYPSFDCFIILNTNLILGLSITTLTITLLCAIIHVCKAICRCCRRSFQFCHKFDRTSISSA